MRILTNKKALLISATFCVATCSLHAQDRTNNINQDPKFEQLLNEKRKINTSIAINDYYKIQIYSGD